MKQKDYGSIMFFKKALKSSVISFRPEAGTQLRNYYEYSERGYQKNVIVYRSIQLIARAIGSVTWLMQRLQNNKVVETFPNHEILDLLRHPNFAQSQSTFLESAVSSLLLSGNCFLLAHKNNAHNNGGMKLYNLRPDRVQVMPGPQALPLGYTYNVGKKRYEFPVDQDTGACDILHIKLYNPLDDWYGMSPVEVAAMSIKQHNAIAQQNSAFLQNGGRPSGALVYKPGTDTARCEELQRNIKELYEGGQNAGKILLLEGDFEWREMGLSPKDLDFVAGKEVAAKEIALAFGIPPILLGALSDATYANYKEARYNFWEETVLPLLNLFANELSHWFQRLFETDLSLNYDITSISALNRGGPGQVGPGAIASGRGPCRTGLTLRGA
jgi:HK97 family phage portal protein